MFTPTEQAIPGETPMLDPLQMQFLTGGQMQYMPQAQFMTPSMYGAFRTMPTANINNMVADGGLWSSFWVSQKTGEANFLGDTRFLKAYNPSISAVQEHVYANRRLDDAATLVGINGVGLSAQLGAGILGSLIGGPLGLGLFGLSMLPFSELGKPIADRLKTTREIQDMSTTKIFNGEDVDRSLGYGFSKRAARNIDKFVRKEAADDVIFDSGDYQEILKLGMEFGQFDYANNAEEYKRILKNMRNSMSTMMEVMGSTDFKDIMQNLKRMRDMGATMEQYNKIAREEQAFARMTGLSYQEAVDTYGKAGAVAFQQSGLNAMQGSLQSMANAANISYMQRTGVLEPVVMAKFGGVSGLTQELTAQDAKVQSKFKEILMPALMNEDLTGIREDLNLAEIVRNPTALQQLINESGRKIRNPEKYITYMQHKDVAYTKLAEKNDMEMFEMEMARHIGNLHGRQGMAAYDFGLIAMGMGAEEAAIKRTAYFSDEVRAAKQRTMEEAKIKEREERAAKNSTWGKLERAFSRFFTQVGEGMFDVFTGARFRSDVAKQTQYDYKHDAPPAINRGDTFKPTGQKDPVFYGSVVPDFLPKMTDQQILDLKNSTEYLDTPEKVNAYLFSAPALVYKETGKSPAEGMKAIDPNHSAMGAFQLTVAEANTGFSKFLLQHGKTDIHNALFEGVDRKHLDTAAAIFKDNGTMRNLSKDVRNSVERLQKNYLALAPVFDFQAAYFSYMKDNIVNDRLNSYTRDKDPNNTNNPYWRKQHKSKMNMLRSNLPVMQALESLANLASPAVFKKLMDKVFAIGGPMGTEEQVQQAIAGHGGMDAVKILFDAADTMPAYKSASKNRFSTNTKDHPDSEYAYLWRVHMGRGTNLDEGNKDAFAQIANNVWNRQAFELYSEGKINHDAKNDPYLGMAIRQDCSGFVAATFKKFKSESKGAIEYKDAFNKAIYAGTGATAGAIYGAHLEAAGGRDDYTIALSGRVDAATEDALQTVKGGDVIYLSGTDPEADSKDNAVYHTALVTEENGKRYVLDLRSSAENRKKVELSKAIREFSKTRHKGVVIHGLNMGHTFAKASGVPYAPAITYNDADDKKAIEDAWSETARLLNTPLMTDTYTYGIDAYEYGIIKELAEHSDEEELLDDMRTSAGDNVQLTGESIIKSLEKPIEVKRDGFFDNALKAWLGDRYSDFYEENPMKYLTQDWRYFFLPGEQKYIDEHGNVRVLDGSKESESFREKAKAAWRPVIARQLLYMKPDMSYQELHDAVEKRLNSKSHMRAQQAFALIRYANDPRFKDVIQKIRDEGYDAVGRVTSRGVNDKNTRHNIKIFQESFAKPLGIDGLKLTNDHRLPDDLPEGSTRRFDTEHNDLSSALSGMMHSNIQKEFNAVTDSFMKAASDQREAVSIYTGKTGYKVGHYYERAGEFMNLYNEYLLRDERSYSQKTKNKIKESLISLMVAGGMPRKQAEEFLTKGYSRLEATRKWLSESTGIDSTKDTAGNSLLENTDIIISKEKQAPDMEALLKDRDYTRLPSRLSDTSLRSNQLSEVMARLSEYFPGKKPEDIINREKTPDTEFEQGQRLLRENKFDSVANYLLKARENNKFDILELGRVITNAGGVNGAVGAGGATGPQYGIGQEGRPVPGVWGAGGSGDVAGASAGAIFKPQTEEAFQKLPGTLEEVAAALTRLNNTMGQLNIPEAKKSNNN